jgi:hypothetical protein
MNIEKKWWEANPHWQNNTIASSGDGKKTSKRWLFLFLLMAIAAFVIYEHHVDLLAHYAAGEYTKMTELIVLLFPLLFFLQQIKKVHNQRRFGETPLVMNPFPAIMGEKFAGYVEIRQSAEQLQFFAELLLMKQVEINQGDNNNTQVDLIWKMPVNVHVESAILGVRLLLEASLPDKKPPSQSPHYGEYYFWQLYIYSKDKSFKRRWQIPVIGKDDYV